MYRNIYRSGKPLYEKIKTMKVIPHIMLKKGDRIYIPQGVCAVVEDLLEGQLLVSIGNNRSTLPWGFYLKKKDGFEPILCLKNVF